MSRGQSVGQPEPAAYSRIVAPHRTPVRREYSTLRKRRALAALVVPLVAVVGCRGTEPDASHDIVLSRGSTLSVSVETEGQVRITAVVPAGAPGEGTYVSTNPLLLEDAHWATNALNEPGGGVTISVDGSRRLIGFGAIGAR